MMENRLTLNPTDLDDFDKRKLPSPGFQVEVVLVYYDGSRPKPRPAAEPANKKSDADSSTSTVARESHPSPVDSNKEAGSHDKDDVFSDSEAEDGSSKGRKEKVSGNVEGRNAAKASETSTVQKEASVAVNRIEKVTITGEQQTTRTPDVTSLKTEVSVKSSSAAPAPAVVESSSMSEFKAIAADASVFSFGDEDYESE